MPDKKVLREAAILRRRQRPDQERAAAGDALAVALRDVLTSATRVAAYVAVGVEPPTGPLLAHCRSVLLPVLRSDNDLDWAVAGELATGPRGLLEPIGPRLGLDAVAECDVVLVPALSVDRVGNRLGRGGGSYDRALRRVRGLTIALLYDGELADDLPTEPHDMPVTAVVTPSYGLQRLRP